MNPNEHISPEDLATLALLVTEPPSGSAEETELAEFRAHLRGCAECRAELRQVRSDFSLYALGRVEPVAPPAGARERFLSALQNAGARAAVTAETGTPTPRTTLLPTLVQRRRSPAALVLPWAGWAVAAAVAVMALGLRQERDGLRQEVSQQNLATARLQADEAKAHSLLNTLTGPGAVRVNLTIPKSKAEPNARATYQQKTGTLLLLAGNLAPLPSQKVYELWLIPANGSSPIPAGTFSPDAHGNASLLVPALHGATTAKAFGITVENAGGSTTPTMPIVLAGAPS